MKWIVGLGNPGPKYSGTRHNVGFMVVSHLAEQWGVPLRKTLCQSKVGEGVMAGKPVGLVLPQTMMNASGEGVACLIRRWKLNPSDLLVICDDISLPLGLIRMRGQGSDGGHKGLASVLRETRTEEVPRLRVGIRAAEMPEDLTAFVLSRFRPSEKKVVEESAVLAVRACEVWVTRGLSAAMNLFNKKTSAISAG